ncbi:hypothetical protein T484DRAFT_1967488 [Baffinella frigidus]|nr:hypothetical protein T484DRAFT_1967488 [Cryptophyta sp. CCMP2293]|mmetsp:Transcript_48184/g.113646  ORF Transcript_48184/g.113646 Transcript_48184/m.113646 type:complete len:587 (+) Transcript_48184:24-1784(+)
MQNTAVVVLALSALLTVQAASKAVDWKDTDGAVQQLQFTGIAGAATDEEKTAWRAVDKVTYKYATSGRDVTYDIEYNKVLMTSCGAKGDETKLGGSMYACNKTAFSDTALPMSVFGVERGIDDAPTVPMVVSDHVGFTSYIPIIGSKGVKLFSIVSNAAVSAFVDVIEYDYKTGKPSPKTRHSSTAGKGKLGSAMGGTMTTWGTHLGFEATATDFSEGFPYEYRVKYDGSVEFAQREAMGRGRWSAMVCMVDKRTCMGFVNDYLVMSYTDSSKDLSNVALYAAKVSTEGMISWTKLTGASATAQATARSMSGKTTDDLWEETTAPCAEGTYTTSDGKCMQIKKGMEDTAARLTTSWVAKAKGATKINNVVGMAYSFEAGKVYASVSNLVNFASETDRACGAILEFKVGKYEVPSIDKETGEEAVDKDGTPVMKTVTAHAVTAATIVSALTSVGEECSPNTVRKATVMSFAQYHNTLFIGEAHTANAAVWAYNTKTSSLARVMTYPTGSMVSSLGWYQNLVGDARSFLFASSSSSSIATARGQTGFLGPFFMPGYSSGSSDILPNTGLPIWDATQANAKVSKYADNL